MAAWYNGETNHTFSISSFGYDSSSMLSYFWEDLIKYNRGRICYFHNWGGYDSILSLSSLLNLPKNLDFDPIMKDGEMMALSIRQGTSTVLTIKDSIRILPGALGKLAKDWKVETQKDHFPHYFFLEDIQTTLKYIGPFPEYRYFEPKRTSLKDYNEMAEVFKTKLWSFLDVSRIYILGDVKALYQILLAFFETLIAKFPIDPLTVLSAPSTAFKIWRTVQLPRLNQEGLKVYDLSKSLDSRLRNAYCGGIVDVYRPHLKGLGYYYDVNSLYPTAMCKPMPVGLPKLVKITVSEFLADLAFFGFLEVTVRAPAEEYVGLLPIKWQGKLICPGGTFSGFFFSEELRFALKNGYTLLEIKLAYSFQRGVNTFLELIEQLNEMKISAQKEGLPTIRNIAKLLMNSMYGRFGMHTGLVHQKFMEPRQLDYITEHFEILSEIPFGELLLVSYTLKDPTVIGTKRLASTLKRFVDSLPGNTNVAIAAAVTAYSRIIINTYKLKALELGLEIYYSDTDSLVVNGTLPENMIDSATLGKLKLEHTFKEGIFVMPKVYYLELEDGTAITKTKGFPGSLTKEQYLALLREESLDLKVTKWSRSLAKGTVQIQRGLDYVLRFSFNKRLIIRDAEGIWTNTTPIKFNT
uniref:Probable DNA polymerase n=1 Tax=Rhizophagus irregularis TaxID=588596 RepID=S4TDH8_9GLOM|nr:truncated DNA polymerase [Rhizophagus irregularis]